MFVLSFLHVHLFQSNTTREEGKYHCMFSSGRIREVLPFVLIVNKIHNVATISLSAVKLIPKKWSVQISFSFPFCFAYGILTVEAKYRVSQNPTVIFLLSFMDVCSLKKGRCLPSFLFLIYFNSHRDLKKILYG